MELIYELGITIYILIGITYTLLIYYTSNKVNVGNIAYNVFAYPYDILRKITRPSNKSTQNKENRLRIQKAEQDFISRYNNQNK